MTRCLVFLQDNIFKILEVNEFKQAGVQATAVLLHLKTGVTI